MPTNARAAVDHVVQAVVDRVLARVVDFFARVDALIHFRRLMFMNVGHGLVLCLSCGLEFLRVGARVSVVVEVVPEAAVV